MQVNRQDELFEDDEVVVEDQSVDRRRHGALERVLEGDETAINGGVGDGAEEVLQ